MPQLAPFWAEPAAGALPFREMPFALVQVILGAEAEDGAFFFESERPPQQ
jgi:hypothetical protein